MEKELAIPEAGAFEDSSKACCSCGQFAAGCDIVALVAEVGFVRGLLVVPGRLAGLD